jgi:hypothetical protein
LTLQLYVESAVVAAALTPKGSPIRPAVDQATWSERLRAAAFRVLGVRPAKGLTRIGAEVGVLDAPSRLVQRFAVALLDLSTEAEAVALGRHRGGVEAVDVAGLLKDVLDLYAPLAASAGLRLSRQINLHRAAARAEAGLLRIALVYLTLRAMVGEPTPGHVRVLATSESGEIKITFTSRAAQPRAETDLSSDLAALGRVLRVFGARLLAEPAYGGYTALTLLLRAVQPETLALAA